MVDVYFVSFYLIRPAISLEGAVMDSACQNSDFSTKYLLGQLNIARKEINNLRYYLHSSVPSYLYEFKELLKEISTSSTQTCCFVHTYIFVVYI